MYVGKAKDIRKNFATYKGNGSREQFMEKVSHEFAIPPKKVPAGKAEEKQSSTRFCCVQVRWLKTELIFQGYAENMLLAALDYQWNTDNNE